MRTILSSIAILAATITPTIADEDDITRVKSDADVAATVARLTQAIEGAGATIFATVDHGEGARGVGADIGDSQLVIFGNPNAGTPVMAQNRLAGLMLPLEILVYQDADGQVWVAHEDVGERIGELDDLDDDDAVLAPLADALGTLSAAAAGAG